MAAQEIQYQATDPPLPPPPTAPQQQDKRLGPLENVARTADFWSRTLTIYAGYKACQVGGLVRGGLGTCVAVHAGAVAKWVKAVSCMPGAASPRLQPPRCIPPPLNSIL